ncbi:MAG: hypothetical protein HY842_00755 [Bacteroidetes bacterium]|nr:hypothetical protein [Bacteroidota bacterium]
MKKTAVFLLFFALASQCFSQVGIVGGYKTFHADGWNDLFAAGLNDTPYPMPGWQIGVDYWFRLKKRRIEFAPEASVAFFKKTFQEGKVEHRQAGLHFNTDVYIFDLAGDCNCPTFSKDGNVFGKGFFLEVSPGVVFLSNKNTTYDDPGTAEEFAFGGSVGAGLDLGFSNVFTITPIARYHYYPNLTWYEALTTESLTTDLTQLFLGLRFRVHFKEINKYGHR